MVPAGADPAVGGSARTRVVVHLAILLVVTVAAYCFGLTDHGLTNTQESLRLTAAREMQATGEWIVPTRLGEPYVAKPPLMYWLMIVLARVRGAQVGLVELRAVVALGGVLGVLATYLAGRLMMGRLGETMASGPGLCTPVESHRRPAGTGQAIAFWAALGLAGGVLFTRSSRIGELDVLMVSTVTLAMALIARAWVLGVERGRVWWTGLVGAAVCAMLAALTKGPIPIALIAVGAYGAVLVEAVAAPAAVRPGWRTAARIVATLAALGVAVVAARGVTGASDWLGVAVFAATAWAVVFGLVRACEPARLARWSRGLWWTQPWLVLGTAAGALWWWLWSVQQRVGAETLDRLKGDEVRENLNILLPQSPVRNLGFMAYGVGAASVAAIGALVWIARDKPAISRGKLVALVWMIGGLVIFSALGKGVARYLTPLWPAIALVGAWWFVSALHARPDGASARRWRWVAVVVLGGQIVGQAWWYGDGRDRFASERSPRDFVRALLDEVHADPSRVGTFGFGTPALDLSLGLPTHDRVGAPLWTTGQARDAWARPLGRLLGRLKAEGPAAPPYWLLAQEPTEAVVRRQGDVRAVLSRRGVPFVELPAEAVPAWTRVPDHTPVRVLVLYPARASE